MKQREVTDKENTRWSCVEAYSGMQGKLAEKAASLAENDENKVPVVCTPSGGAQSVRLELDKSWIENMPDDELIEKIINSRN